MSLTTATPQTVAAAKTATSYDLQYIKILTDEHKVALLVRSYLNWKHVTSEPHALDFAEILSEPTLPGETIGAAVKRIAYAKCVAKGWMPSGVVK